MPKDVIITPASGKLDFYATTGGSVLANINLTDNNDLSLSTTSGNLIIGDASRDVYIGDGTNEVDIVFEQNGEIRSVAGKYITVNAGTVNATGVAVNTSSPTAVMHVYGSTPSGTVLNVEGTNGSLFSVVDNLDGTLMSVNNNAGLPVLEVFSDDSIIGGRFGQNDFVVSSGGNVGIGLANPSTKLEVSGTIKATNFSGVGSSLTAGYAQNIVGEAGGDYNASSLPPEGAIPYISEVGTTVFRLRGNSGQVLKSNGDVPVWGSVQYSEISGTVPTWNQNTTGTAANITATSNTTLTTLSNLVSVGTITTGVWSASTIGVNKGGTGATTFTTGEVLVGNGTGAVSTLSRSGIDSRSTFPPSTHNQAESTITFTDITTGNASTSAHGYLPKLGGGTTNYLRADGSWATPPDTNTTYAGSTSIILTGGAFQRAALTGDVTATQNNNDTTIANNAVSNAKAADMAVNTIKGRITAGTGDPEDLTAANVRSIINVADGANNYVHPTDGANTTINAANLKVLSAITVNNLGHVTSVSSKDLTSNDIPSHSITAHSATAWRMFFSNATTSTIQELSFGSSGTYLRSAGASANPTWATIAYSELSGTPTIPTVNDATLTLNVSGTGLSGSQTFTANQSSNATFTVTSNATSANTASTIVARDASGNFSAGTITAGSFVKTLSAGEFSTDLLQAGGGVVSPGSLSVSYAGTAGSANQVANTLTRGSYLTGNNFNGSAATTWAVDAATANTASKIVARDASGNFSAGTITAELSGNASTATTLQNSRTITIGATGRSFNGSANISWTLADIGAQATLTNPVTGTGTLNYISKWSSSSVQTNSIIFDNGTNVGIGTTTPNAKVHVYGTVASGVLLNVEGTNGSLFSVIDDLTGSLMSVNTVAGLPVFEVFDDYKVVAGRYNQNDFVVSSSGNVGLGVANPSTKLEVSGTIKATVFNGAGTNLTGTASSLTVGSLYDANQAISVGVGTSQYDIAQRTNYISVVSLYGVDWAENSLYSETSATATYADQLNYPRNLWGQSFNGTANVSGNISGAGNITMGTQANKATLTYTTNTARTYTIPDAGANADFVLSAGNQNVGGVKTFTSQIINTTANSTANGGGQIYLNGATGNRIDFNTNGVAAPSFTTRSAGTKIVLYPEISSNTVDYAIGIEGNTLWHSIPNTSSSQFRWYGGTTNIATLTGAGVLTVAGSTSQINVDNLKLDNNIVGVNSNNTNIQILSSGINSNVYLGPIPPTSSSPGEQGFGVTADSLYVYDSFGFGESNDTVGEGIRFTYTGGVSTLRVNNNSGNGGSVFKATADSGIDTQGRLTLNTLATNTKATKINEILQLTTSNNTANTIMPRSYSTSKLILPAQSTWCFIINLSAYNSTDNVGAAWIFKGAIRRNNSAGTALIGSVLEENWKETGMTAASANVVANDTDDSLDIRVTGLSSKTIHWTASIDLTQANN